MKAESTLESSAMGSGVCGESSSSIDLTLGSGVKGNLDFSFTLGADSNVKMDLTLTFTPDYIFKNGDNGMLLQLINLMNNVNTSVSHLKIFLLNFCGYQFFG